MQQKSAQGSTAQGQELYSPGTVSAFPRNEGSFEECMAKSKVYCHQKTSLAEGISEESIVHITGKKNPQNIPVVDLTFDV